MLYMCVSAHVYIYKLWQMVVVVCVCALTRVHVHVHHDGKQIVRKMKKWR